MLKFFIIAIALAFALTDEAKAQTGTKVEPKLPPSAIEYYGAKHQEAQFTFETQIFVPTSLGTPTDELLKTEFKMYTKYILGQMRRTHNNPSALYPKFSVHVNKFEKASDSFYRVNVQFSGKGVFNPNLKEYTFMIPIYKGNFFEKSKGQCTEATDVDDGNFWYHWDPKKSGCPFIENKDYTVVNAPLNYITNTTKTYPEYEKLIRNGGLRMTLFFGLADYDDNDWNPDTNHSDWGVKGFRREKEVLTQLGFEAYIWTEAEVRKWYNPESGRPIPHLETLTKKTPHGLMTIRLFLGNTGLDHDSRAFHLFYKDSIWNDSVMVYNGHSGIGKNLDTRLIGPLRGIKMPISNDYQVFFLGSCVPYSYYTDLYFTKKSSETDPTGTKGLEIITYGNESTFSNIDDIRLTTALMEYMDTGKRTSYQDIVGPDADYFLGVNGDEDNPTN